MEISFFDTEIEQFCKFPRQYLPVDQFEDIHDVEREISGLIK